VSVGGAPQSIGSVVEANCVYQDLAIQSGWLFGAETHHGNIDFFDLSRDTAPLLAYSIDLPEATYHLDARGGHAYAGGTHDFRILDLADPTSPVEVGRWQNERTMTVYGYAVSGNHAYVPVCTGRTWVDDLVVLEVSDPSAPQVVNVIEGFQGSQKVPGTQLWGSPDAAWKGWLNGAQTKVALSLNLPFDFVHEFHGVLQDGFRFLLGDQACDVVDGLVALLPHSIEVADR
jgi:hypothetical protein